MDEKCLCEIINLLATFDQTEKMHVPYPTNLYIYLRVFKKSCPSDRVTTSNLPPFWKGVHNNDNAYGIE